jgi:ABC-2 type transport system ATP-binding protein
MTISLSDTGKRFNREWIFRHFTYQFETGSSYAITGPNGSGKSTLLQVLSGNMMLNEGSIKWLMAGNNLQAAGNSSSKALHQLTGESVYKYISICAPYLELVEEMTLKELLAFHQTFKPFIDDLTAEKIVTILGLEKAANKQIRYYSSGMKQRVKLAQCIFSDVPVILLDEPCTNLDTEGITLYHQLISNFCLNRLVIVSSNDKTEYEFCKQVIHLGDYKQ